MYVFKKVDFETEFKDPNSELYIYAGEKPIIDGCLEFPDYESFVRHVILDFSGLKKVYFKVEKNKIIVTIESRVRGMFIGKDAIRIKAMQDVINRRIVFY